MTLDAALCRLLYARPSGFIELLQIGVVDYLVKPIDNEKLTNAVAKALAQITLPLYSGLRRLPESCLSLTFKDQTLTPQYTTTPEMISPRGRHAMNQKARERHDFLLFYSNFTK